MIVFLHGKLAQKSPAKAVVECGGVGYEALIPLSTYERLPATGGEVMLLTHHEVREDAQLLYGFASEAERDLFALLVSVSGVGPKAALGILSSNTPEALSVAILSGNERALTVVPGIGKKMAQRILLELRDKISKQMEGTVPDGFAPGVSEGPAGKDKLSDAAARSGDWVFERCHRGVAVY